MQHAPGHRLQAAGMIQGDIIKIENSNHHSSLIVHHISIDDFLLQQFCKMIATKKKFHAQKEKAFRLVRDEAHPRGEAED